MCRNVSSWPQRVEFTFADLICSGIDGIVVTNHAGRQVDGAIASLDALEKIVEAVGDSIYVCILLFHTLH